jgi:hypothetical protein
MLAGLRDGAWLDQQVFPRLTYAVPGVVPEGSTLLAGAPKIGKSLLVLGFALGVSCGGMALGMKVERRPVLYLALEDGHRRMQDRCRALLEGETIPAGFHYLIRVEPGTELETIDAWLRRQHDDAPLVILDTLGRAMPPAMLGESPYSRDYRVGAALKRLADDYPGTALLVNHHDRKAASADFVETVSGTNGLAGAADTIVTLSRRRHEARGVLRVTGRDVAEGAYAMELDGHGSWRLLGNDLDEAAANAFRIEAIEGVGDRMADVIEFVCACPNGTTPRDVADALAMSNDDAGKYLRRAAEKNRIVRISRGVFACKGVSEASERPKEDMA